MKAEFSGELIYTVKKMQAYLARTSQEKKTNFCQK